MVLTHFQTLKRTIKQPTKMQNIEFRAYNVKTMDNHAKAHQNGKKIFLKCLKRTLFEPITFFLEFKKKCFSVLPIAKVGKPLDNHRT